MPVVAAVVAAVVALIGTVCLVRTRAHIAHLRQAIAEGTTTAAIHQARQRIITSRSGLCSFELDVVARTASWSPDLEALHGLEPGTFDGTFAAMLAFASSPDDLAAVERGLAQVVLNGEAAFVYRIRRPDGEERWLEAWAREVVLPGDVTTRVLGAAADVTERKRAEADLDHLARHDVLTGLPNRTGVIEHLTDVARHSTGALLLLDLDGFKEINDALGHGMGDVVLKEVARRLSACVREADVVARLGGDEFGLVLHELADVSVAMATANRVLGALSEPFHVASMALHVSGSIGIAAWPAHGTTPSALLKHADVAMYRAKERNNCAVVYEPLQSDGRAARLTLVADLRQAIEDDVIDVHYQPIVDLPHDEVVGLEALARWRRAGGDIPPVVFVPLAEQSGLIHDLTPLVLRKALDEARRWQEDGFGLRVSVNISPKVLTGPSFAEDVKYALLAAGVLPSRLILEITETALAEPTRELIESLEELRAMGVSIALDDFGAGYSCLTTLTELPVDILKIDRSFLSRLPAPNAVGVVRAIIEMARHLGIETVAEGVEGESAASLLRELGCGFAQGYHFGRPGPHVDLRAIRATVGP